METRMERYAKYRESIKRMAPDQFPPRKSEPINSSSSDNEDFPVPTYESLMEEGKENARTGPYSLYLKRRRRNLAIKLIVLVLVAAGFLVWWFLLQGRK